MKNLEYEIEKCVCCGKQVDIPRMTPISNREYYIIGAGQLCIECYCSLCDSANGGANIMSDRQMEHLIDRCQEK